MMSKYLGHDNFRLVSRYDLVTDAETFYKWLETCPVHYRFRRLDEDYVEFGFFSVQEHSITLEEE